MSELFCFLDANTLLHYRLFTEIPWTTILNANHVTLVIAPIILDELDEKKSLSKPRLQKRAKMVLSKLNHLPLNVRSQIQPNVSIWFYDDISKTVLLDANLDPDIQDNWLIGSVLDFKQNTPLAQVQVVTADINLRRRLAKRNICDSINLPPELEEKLEEDEGEKERKGLERELNKLRNRTPKLAVQVNNNTGMPTGAIELRLLAAIRDISSAVDARINEERAYLKPLSEDTSPIYNGVARRLQPSIYNKRLETYFNRSTEYWREIAETRQRRALTFELNFIIINDGGAPAEDIDITLQFPSSISVSIEKPTFKESSDSPNPPSPFIFEPAIPTLAFPVIRTSSPFLQALRVLDQLNTPRPSLELSTSADGATEISYTMHNIKHNTRAEIPCIFITLPKEDPARRFGITYKIRAGNIADRVDGTIPVFIELTEGPIALHPPTKPSTEETDDNS